MKPTIVTSGVDAEYVLGELSAKLRDEGYDVIEYDFGKTKHCVLSEIKALANGNVVYITSAHTNLTQRVAAAMLGQLQNRYPNYLAPLEFLPLLKPRLSLYVPHDLLTPYGDSNLQEYRFLDLFDHVLAPYDGDSLQPLVGANTKVHDAGWIKFRGAAPLQQLPPAPSGLRVTLFVSFVEHLQHVHGVEGFVEYLRPILTPDVRVKLPLWGGVVAMEDALRAKSPAQVVPAATNSIDLISDSDVVICNGASSIQAESSLMGKPTICLLDNEAETAETKQQKLRPFPAIRFHDYSQRQPFPDGFLSDVAAHPPARKLRPFDYDLVRRLAS